MEADARQRRQTHSNADQEQRHAADPGRCAYPYALGRAWRHLAGPAGHLITVRSHSWGKIPRTRPTILLEAHMALRDSFLPEFDHEMETTRKTLERVPEDKTTWKPHDTSMPMGRLAGHIAEMAGFAAQTFNGDSFDFAPPGGAPMKPTVMTSRKELLEIFDKNVAAARAAISKASDEDLKKTWT